MLPDLWNFSHIENTAPVVHRKSIHSVVRGVMALHLLQMERLVVQQLTLLYSRHSEPCSTKPFLTTLRAVGHWQVEMLPSSVLLVQPVLQLAARLLWSWGTTPPLS